MFRRPLQWRIHHRHPCAKYHHAESVPFPSTKPVKGDPKAAKRFGTVSPWMRWLRVTTVRPECLSNTRRIGLFSRIDAFQSGDSGQEREGLEQIGNSAGGRWRLIVHGLKRNYKVGGIAASRVKIHDF